ncbi:sugar ABC transporter ATP-binding protein [Verminephrobacter eiseniae]|nr:sugar ABC transporter ATP-binding protein [Verminephrobacter eiseniae]MCW5283475.1 sugar ABC transporter ATP-binding protein [Verminephrobacter eiseniae]MCW5301184.1 sugar ABC transporter ATP-binding protein [Verminephrobacter eiseniae]MCW8180180.1 sugar ABC transporter ATP-binding protein [Verminephrobacter eiseniae]MCW8189208.1 sugar ABC transporter ATP-binding protein [Verminephrobacter eiseniae]
MSMSELLLSLRGVHKSYGATHALCAVDLDLHCGQVLALVGENGAGKSTLVKLLTGVVPMDAGSIRLQGVAQQFANAHAAQAAGILAVHQETVMFEELSVAENIFMGRHLLRGSFVDWPAMNAQAQAALTDIGARFGARTLVKDLSLAERHLVEIARALSQKARVVILDEPTAALSQTEIRDFYGIVRKLRAQGAGVIFISHKFDEIFALADRYLVLRDGAVVGSGAMAEASEQELLRLMAGRAIDQIYPQIHSTPGEPVLRVRQLSHPTQFQNLNFELRRGEILGFYGLIGAGRSQAMLAIMGLNPQASGQVQVLGQKLDTRRPGAAIAAGIAYVPEERQRQGGILDFSVQANISLAGLARFATGPWLSARKESALCRRMVERLRIKIESPRMPLSGLSGGNQQKVVIAKWLGLEPKIVILDEPTKGIDVGAKQAVYQLIAEMVGQGLAVILVSSELSEVMHLAHRVIVMRRGLQVAEFAQQQIDAEAIVAAASGLVGSPADRQVAA